MELKDLPIGTSIVFLESPSHIADGGEIIEFSTTKEEVKIRYDGAFAWWKKTNTIHIIKIREGKHGD